MSQTYTFGSGVLWGIRNDSNAPAVVTPTKFGTVQSVEVSFDGEIKPLFGQYQYPVAQARGKTQIMGKAQMANISVKDFNDLFFGGSITTGQNRVKERETSTIPGTPYQITVTGSATFETDLGVYNNTTGKAMTKVASAPATGQYSVAAGVYTFAAADTTNSVSIDYQYGAASTGNGLLMPNQLMGVTPSWAATFYATYGGAELVLTLFNCVSSKITPFSTKLDDWNIPELDFAAFANSAGNVFEWTGPTN